MGGVGEVRGWDWSGTHHFHLHSMERNLVIWSSKLQGKLENEATCVTRKISQETDLLILYS